MRSFWSAQSALLIPNPPTLATPTLLRLLRRNPAGFDVIYAGDRMWPAVKHGQVLRALPIADRPPQRGDVVLVSPAGIPDLLRIDFIRGDRIGLSGDADPAGKFEASPDAVLARVPLAHSASPRAARVLRRLFLDHREAVLGRPDVQADPADTVRAKYDAQAPFYAAAPGAEMAGPLLEWVVERVRPGGRVLIAGCGTGREALAMARAGFSVRGIDFSASMVEAARRSAAQSGLGVEIVCGDLRAHEEPPGSLDAVFFTYDVFSFIPRAEDRIALLRRMKGWLVPGAAIFLSARRFERLYDPWILTVQRAARIADPRARWGQSHTRWIAPDGALHRSFVQVFTDGALRRELRCGGFVSGPWRGNHCLLSPAP